MYPILFKECYLSHLNVNHLNHSYIYLIKKWKYLEKNNNAIYELLNIKEQCLRKRLGQEVSFQSLYFDFHLKYILIRHVRFIPRANASSF